MDKDVIKKYAEAGVIAREALNLGEQLIKPGLSMNDALGKIESFIFSKGAFPAFPPQISLNSVAAHFYPDEPVMFKENDMAKLDVGVSVDGYVADTARTFYLGDDERLKKLVFASQKALEEALKIIKPGVKTGDIGRVIQNTITGLGFTPIKNLSGHGLDRFKVHGAPSIPNIAFDDSVTLEEGMVIAIEPFATDGAGLVYESGVATLFSLLYERPVRSPITKQVLSEIKKFNGFPFSSVTLINKFGKPRTLFALRELKQLGVLQEHPALVDRNKGIVSQAEHSVIVLKEPLVYTRDNIKF